MAATPSDSACFVSSKVSLKLQPETCKIPVKRKTLEKGSSVIYIFLSPSKDYNMYKSQGQRTKCNDFAIKCTCAMMVGQWSFWCTHASSSSFLSLSDRDCWKCKVENLVELSYLDLGAVLIFAPAPPLQSCRWQKRPWRHLLLSAWGKKRYKMANFCWTTEYTKNIWKKWKETHIPFIMKVIGTSHKLQPLWRLCPHFPKQVQTFHFQYKQLYIYIYFFFFENVIFIKWRVILFIFSWEKPRISVTSPSLEWMEQQLGRWSWTPLWHCPFNV